MKAQEIESLSAKSRGILYHFKSVLKKNKTNVEQHINNVFGFSKAKFNKKQFHNIILKYDDKLVLSEIDSLFDELDENKNDVVFYQTIAYALANVTELDNPDQKLNRVSKIKNQSKEYNSELAVLIDIKDFLLNTQYYREIIDMFSTEQDGFLSQQNFQELLNNFGYVQKVKRQTAVKAMFPNKKIISIKELLIKLGLDNNATRINLQDFKKQNMQQLNLEQSIYIKEQKKSKIRFTQNHNESKIMKQENSLKSLSFFVADQSPNMISLQNIPQALQHYFNYGSQLEQHFGYIAAQYIQNNLVYIDDQSPLYSKAAGVLHIAEISPHYQLFNKARSVVHRNRKGLGQMLEPKDIIQGQMGDCYFLSALAAIVEDYPQLVYRLFVLQKNPSHMFGVRLFIQGIWKTIPLDGTFPINHYRGFCGAQPHQNQIWVMLLQKAWAKCFGSYDNIHSGYNQEGLSSISGAPTIIVSSRSNGFLKKIEVQFTKGSILTCATSSQVIQLTNKQQEQIGVVAGHAYTLLKIYADLPYKDKTITLLKLRNPWGKKVWKKDWSYTSNLWTQELRDLVGHKSDPQDGSFFISIDDFTIYFDHINISRVNLGYLHTWITIKANRYEFYQNRVTVKNKGDYNFTLYQQNKRRYKNSGSVFQKSKSCLFLAKIQSQTEYGQIKKIKTIACNAESYRDNTIQTTLDAGNYILISSVNWNYWEDHCFNITCYGAGRVAFSQGFVAGTDILSKIIESKSQEVANYGGGSVTVYQKLNISKSIYCSISEGIGFITINNHDQVILNTQITMAPCHGIKFIPPYSLPLQLTVLPFQTIVCPFLVDPSGYNYRIGERYKTAL